ncbi:hypothetical protein QQ045_005942 [Rhodiola kirilowii]
MPVGYRFHPTDVELVNHYLKLKNQGSDRYVSNIQEIDVCKWEPWELPERLGSESDDQEWYFFGRRESKYGKSSRSNRATKVGYWKPTGKDRYIKMGSKKVIGTKKTLVFHIGRAQKAVRTHWVMHEYCASVDKHNPQAFVLYLLKKKSDENPDLPISDGADPNRSSPSASLVNNAPSHSPSTPTVLQGSANFSSSVQSRLNQNGKEQEVSSHAQNNEFDLAFLEDIIESCFDGQQPTWEGVERMLPAIPLSNYPNQGPIHTTARYLNQLNVLNNDHAVTQFQNMMRRKEIVDIIDSGSSILMGTPETLPLDSESGTETDNDVPQSLFGEDALHGGSAYLSDSESSDQEFYNDMILAQEVSLSVNSGIVQRVELDGEGPKKPITSGAHGTAATNLRTRSYSQVPAQASGKKEYGNVPPKTSESKILNAVSDDSSVEYLCEAQSFRIPKVAGNESSGRLGGNSHNMGFIVYADNPRVNNGTTPPSNYILNIAIGLLAMSLNDKASAVFLFIINGPSKTVSGECCIIISLLLILELDFPIKLSSLGGSSNDFDTAAAFSFMQSPPPTTIALPGLSSHLNGTEPMLYSGGVTDGGPRKASAWVWVWSCLFLFPPHIPYCLFFCREQNERQRERVMRVQVAYAKSQ